MNENYRHRQLLNLLDERKILSTNEIIAILQVSPATARRDITKLDEQGRLRKVRNGAEAINADLMLRADKSINNFDEKQRIAKAASQLCHQGDSVILTCGSTMKLLGSELCGQRLQIITNYLPLANQLIDNGHEDIVILGGQYNRDKAITLSLNAQNETQYSASIMFTSGKGFTEAGLYKTDMIIANSEHQMSSRANKYVVLLDSSKLGKQVGMLFSELKEIDLLITGKEADPQIVQNLQAAGLKVFLA